MGRQSGWLYHKKTLRGLPPAPILTRPRKRHDEPTKRVAVPQENADLLILQVPSHVLLELGVSKGAALVGTRPDPVREFGVPRRVFQEFSPFFGGEPGAPTAQIHEGTRRACETMGPGT